MPIYSYVCINCKKEFEYFHVNSEDKSAECAHCGAKETDELKHEKQIPKNTSHILKGTGWYKDGY